MTGSAQRAVDFAIERLAKVVGAASRRVGAGAGSTLPGQVLLGLRPSYISRKAASLAGGCLIVSGSNGKTTTSSMIRGILERDGRTIAANVAGANLRTGIATALLDSPRDAQIGVFEVDEAALPALVSALRPRMLVLTNIVRDQLDRFGEPQKVAELLRRAVANLGPDAVVVANADDPLLWHAVREYDDVRGFSLEVTGATKVARDAAADGEPETCPSCGAALTYSSRTVAHFGRARCGNCSYEPREPSDFGRVVHERGLAGIEVELGGATVSLSLGGIHTAYNALAAYATTTALGVSATTAQGALESFSPRFGRAETLSIEGRDAHVALMKNPVSAGVILREICSDPSVGAVALCVCDRTADGKDISWIWDADFERLSELGIPLIAAGTRAEDVAVRLKYAAMKAVAIEEDPARAIAKTLALCPDGRVPVFLATYTGMLDLRRAALASRRARVEDQGP